MIVTKEKVYEACKVIAPMRQLDPKLVYAICLQEGDKEKNGDFNPSVARLEQNFYRRYTEPMNYATTTEILLAASFGVMQMLGESLREVGFFDWFFNHQSEQTKAALGHSMSQMAVVKAIDAYCDNLSWMIDWGCQWFNKKLSLAKGNIPSALGYWNGDRTGKYAQEVLDRLKNIK